MRSLYPESDGMLMRRIPTGTRSFSSRERPDWVDTPVEVPVCWSWVSFLSFLPLFPPLYLHSIALQPGVAGGAVFPPIQAAIADAVNTRVSFWICLPAFLEIAAFGFWAWNKEGRKFGAAKPAVRRANADEEEYPAGELGFRADEKKDEVDYLEKKSDL